MDLSCERCQGCQGCRSSQSGQSCDGCESRDNVSSCLHMDAVNTQEFLESIFLRADSVPCAVPRQTLLPARHCHSQELAITSRHPPHPPFDLPQAQTGIPRLSPQHCVCADHLNRRPSRRASRSAHPPGKSLARSGRKTGVPSQVLACRLARSPCACAAYYCVRRERDG